MLAMKKMLMSSEFALPSGQKLKISIVLSVSLAPGKRIVIFEVFRYF